MWDSMATLRRPLAPGSTAANYAARCQVGPGPGLGGCRLPPCNHPVGEVVRLCHPDRNKATSVASDDVGRAGFILFYFHSFCSFIFELSMGFKPCQRLSKFPKDGWVTNTKMLTQHHLSFLVNLLGDYRFTLLQLLSLSMRFFIFQSSMTICHHKVLIREGRGLADGWTRPTFMRISNIHEGWVTSIALSSDKGIPDPKNIGWLW